MTDANVNEAASPRTAQAQPGSGAASGSVAAQNNTVVIYHAPWLLEIIAKTSGDSLIAVLDKSKRHELGRMLLWDEAEPQNDKLTDAGTKTP
jgi:hypothetical protein